MKDLDKVYAEQLASEYAPKNDSKVVRLKKLNAKVKNPPMFLAYTIGIIGALILGVGMCLTMNQIGPGGNLGMVLGIIIGIIGIVIVGINYPIYTKFLKTRKSKYAFEITELAKDISNN